MMIDMAFASFLVVRASGLDKTPPDGGTTRGNACLATLSFMIPIRAVCQNRWADARVVKRGVASCVETERIELDARPSAGESAFGVSGPPG